MSFQCHFSSDLWKDVGFGSRSISVGGLEGRTGGDPDLEEGAVLIRLGVLGSCLRIKQFVGVCS